MKLKLVLDENIPHAKEIFSPFGEIKALPGRSISNADLKEADALIIRSVTNVDGKLVAGTNVKFVGTCTIGTDHVKENDLKEQGVYFCSAPGCNAQSVAEYVVCSLLEFGKVHNVSLKDKSLGIVGVGNVGSIVAKYAEALEMKVLLNDPPRQRAGDPLKFVSFDQILKCDFITLHVPLNKTGIDKTHFLIDSNTLKKMNSNAVIINSCRGSVINNNDLKQALRNKAIKAAILDVWENEPNIDRELFDLCFIGSPHIAGYSYDAKIRGSTMIAEKLCGHFKLNLPDYSQLGLPEQKKVSVNELSNNDEAELKKICNLFYSPIDDHLMLKDSLSSTKAGENFDNLRKRYRKRREFQIIALEYLQNMPKESLAKKMKLLQFRNFS